MPSTATAQSQTFSNDISCSGLFNPIKNQRFNPLPASIACRRDLSANAKLTYAYLASCYGRDGLVCPKISTISNQCGLSPRSASRAITELKQAGLIAIMRTGRASYYRFINPDQQENLIHNPVDQVSVDQPEPVNRSAKPGASDTPNLTHQPPPTPLYKNKSPKKQTTARRVVVSLADDDQVKTCLNAIPDQHQTPSTEKIIRISLTSHSLDSVMQAINYTNNKSTKNYGAYLNLTLKKIGRQTGRHLKQLQRGIRQISSRPKRMQRQSGKKLRNRRFNGLKRQKNGLPCRSLKNKKSGLNTWGSVRDSSVNGRACCQMTGSLNRSVSGCFWKERLKNERGLRTESRVFREPAPRPLSRRYV